MRHNYDPGTKRLREDLRDYYGTAMFNGNPMAMMELEEVERASRSELNDIARRNGFDPFDYSTTYDSPYGGSGSARGISGSPCSRGASGTGIGVGVSAHCQTISESTRTFFEPRNTNPAVGFFTIPEPSKSSSDTSFFANYAKRLKDSL